MNCTDNLKLLVSEKRPGGVSPSSTGRVEAERQRRPEDDEGIMRIPIILRAVATSWIVVFANGAVGFCLTPFVLHRLGDEAFGLWVLVVTVAGYYGVFDFGICSAVLRYAALKRALGEKDGINEVVATAFYFYVCACLVVILSRQPRSRSNHRQDHHKTGADIKVEGRGNHLIYAVLFT